MHIFLNRPWSVRTSFWAGSNAGGSFILHGPLGHSCTFSFKMWSRRHWGFLFLFLF